eukprot:scaffold232997_cov33-Tisochrysis_lutea.AAC.8
MLRGACCDDPFDVTACSDEEGVASELEPASSAIVVLGAMLVSVSLAASEPSDAECVPCRSH